MKRPDLKAVQIALAAVKGPQTAPLRNALHEALRLVGRLNQPKGPSGLRQASQRLEEALLGLQRELQREETAEQRQVEQLVNLVKVILAGTRDERDA